MHKFSTPTQRVRVECNDTAALLNSAHFFTIARKKPNGRFEALFDVAPAETTTFDGNLYFYVSLTQEQTGMFADNETAYMQLNVITPSGVRTNSGMAAFRLEPALKAQVIEYTDTTESEGENE